MTDSGRCYACGALRLRRMEDGAIVCADDTCTSHQYDPPIKSVRDWKAEAEWAVCVSKAKTERLDAYILTVGTIRKTIDMWRNHATESGDAMVQVTEAICDLDEIWAPAKEPNGDREGP